MKPHNAIHTIAFYNTENLFDVYADPKKLDNDFLPIASKNWTKQRFERKIQKLGTAISKIGLDTAHKPPVLVGLAEVENDAVIENLLQSDALKPFNYGFVHYNSLDERGIDVALLYNKDNFTLEHSKAFPIYVADPMGNRDFTRDILLVTGKLDGQRVHILVNHWPSRHEGTDTTEPKRIETAKQLADIINDILADDFKSQLIVMGDFNDNPTSASLRNLKTLAPLFNTMESVWSYSRGSTTHNFAWIFFDQIFLTHNFLGEGDGPMKLLKADVFDEKFLTQFKGKYKGQPFRTYLGRKYIGGYSDHFPVFIQIEI